MAKQSRSTWMDSQSLGCPQCVKRPMRSRTTVWICSGMRQVPFSLVDRGCSCLINAWASVFMNNRCPMLVKKMTPVAPCCCSLFDCVCPLSGLAGFSAVMIDMYPPISCTRSLSDIDRSTTANDLRPSASFSARKNLQRMYSREYASGFSRPAASHLAAPPSPRHEGNVGRAPECNCTKLLY